jgi:hypothetical protein
MELICDMRAVAIINGAHRHTRDILAQLKEKSKPDFSNMRAIRAKPRRLNALIANMRVPHKEPSAINRRCSAIMKRNLVKSWSEEDSPNEERA